MKKPRIKFYTERTSFWVEGAVIFMALAIIFRIIGCWGLWTDTYFALTQIALPIASGLLFILLLALLGKHALWTTFLPVLMGVAFFILKAFTFDSTVQTVLCVLLYVLVAVLYVGTVFTLIRTKWLLVPLFALPFLYHVLVEDMQKLQDTANPVTFAAGMQEMSVLCIMLSLLFTALGMKKLVKEPKAELPKIKDPKVIPPEAGDTASAQGAAEAAAAEAAVQDTSASVEAAVEAATAEEAGPAKESILLPDEQEDLTE